MPSYQNHHIYSGIKCTLQYLLGSCDGENVPVEEVVIWRGKGHGWVHDCGLMAVNNKKPTANGNEKFMVILKSITQQLQH